MRGIKGKDGSVNCGVMRAVSPSPAPRLKFGAVSFDRKVDLRKYCSPVRDQGRIGSCCAQSLVGGLELLMIKGGEPLQSLSPMFLFYNARKMSDSQNQIMGTFTAHANAAVMAFGVCPEEYWPYVADQATSKPSDNAYRQASAFEAVQYARLATTDEVKATLTSGLPVMFGSDIGMAYYREAERTGRMPELGGAPNGEPCSHAMLVVGYDEDDKSFLVKNSWGEGWGDKGYARVPYSVFDRHVWDDDMWVIGALERNGPAKLVGDTPSQALAYVQQNGASEMREALKKLGQEIREDLEKRVSDAKTSIRDRLRAQENAMEAKRKKDGEG